MDRRQVLKISGAALGYSLAGGTIAAVLGGCKADVNAKPADLELFDDATYNLLVDLTETIIPATDTPGAKDANVVSYLHNRLKYFSTAEEQTQMLKGFKQFDLWANEKHQKNYLDLKIEEKEALLNALVLEARDNEDHIFNVLRSETVVGFFTSEVGATQVLRFDPIPGVYQGCIDYKPGEAAWAL